MKKKFIIMIAAVLCMILSFTVVAIAVDDTQILVAKDYFDQVVSTLASKSYVDSKVQSGGGDTYIVLEQLPNGSVVVGGASTEMILRSGSAKAYIPAEAGGGISDLTGGSDIGNGKSISKNHLLLFPRDDGRALQVTSDNTFIMVKGSYTLQ